MSFKRVNTNNLMTFECYFLIAQHHENCSAMSSFTVLRHVPWNNFICSAVQCFHQFAMDFIYCLLSCVMVSIYYLLSFFLSNAADKEHSQLAEIPVKRSIFECNIQKSVPRSLQLKNIVIFKNRNKQLRFEIPMTDIRDQLMTNDKFPEFSER